MEEIIRAQKFRGREIVTRVENDKIWIYTLPSGEHCGHRSKEIGLKRFVELDDLFFVGLGLWRGEGGKSKGLYFGNSEPALLRHFLNFVEYRFGLNREKFKITLNVPTSSSLNEARKKWANELSIPHQNFTEICVDPRIRKEYAQAYFNSVILSKLMGDLYQRSKNVILQNQEFSVAFLRGVFAAEGSVMLKNSGVLHHITFSSKDDELIHFLRQSLHLVGVRANSYSIRGMNLQIYGLTNFRRIRELSIHALHPEKREKFERGFSAYRRTNVLDGEEARRMILEQLASGPKTYDELATALGKARTTIQAHHIPILEKQGLVKRAGKRGQAWMWSLCSL
ncbi:MAG: LAGLIDADG family homing endonuclease [Candidatus Hadarchaeales archaeon]